MTRAPSDRAPVTQADRRLFISLFSIPTARRHEVLAGKQDHLPEMGAIADHRIAAVEAAAEACRQREQDFLSPEYATGQPISTIQERFACRECAAAILSLKGQSDDR